jgi:glycogen operon protein
MIKQRTISAGAPAPLGASLSRGGCNFAVHSPEAEQVFLCLFDKDTEIQVAEISMQARTGDVWHTYVNDISLGQLYAYRTEGLHEPENGLCFDKNKLLIDPYAKQLTRPLVWDSEKYHNDSQSMIPKGIVGDQHFDWQNAQKPRTPMKDTVIYETHVKGLTIKHPDLPKAIKGTYLGACHPNTIQHLKDLGVTAVQLLPVFAFMSERFVTEKGLTNYWGYNPINFFSPEPRYALNNAVAEFKEMVREFHKAGLEVILDVVYNHTAESGFDGPTLSFRGFDNRSFYLYTSNEYGHLSYREPINNSGCGNSLNISRPYAYQIIMDSLRYWTTEMQVDGFRFDLAASLCRDPYEYSKFSGFLRMIRQDPVLQDSKLIAEPWDIGMGGYRLGQFPSNWLEVNDKYRDTVRAFWRGDKGLASEFATRLLGSRDIFHKGKRTIHSSVNSITYHDGFTLEDLVSYSERHNLANLERNRDGHGHNLSSNYGIEGPTDNVIISDLRERQKRNLFATLMLSQGTPHVLGADELSRTQQGNNNAYCQDNEISWVDWQLNASKSDFLGFCKELMALRKSSTVLSDIQLADDHYSTRCNVKQIHWYLPDGEEKTAEDWHEPDNQAFAIEIKGVDQQEHWLLLFNASKKDIAFVLPQNKHWHLLVDTNYANCKALSQGEIHQTYELINRSLGVLKYSR